jgi:prephenate dehydrogenase
VSDPDFSRAPRIDILVIQGVGLIGGSLGMAARRRGLAREVIGIGRDRSRLDAALRLGAIDRYCVGEVAALAEACAEADLVVLCTPVSKIIADLPVALSASGPKATITDVGSVKQAIVDAAGGDPRFVGSHPMAGSELAGIYAAKEDLFHDATWALTPTETTNPDSVACVRNLARGVGARARVLTADRHDECVGITSHLPHVIAYALAALAERRRGDNADIPFLTAGSYAGATRVAASHPDLWTDISRANRAQLASALRDFRAALDRAQDAIDAEDWQALKSLYDLGWEAKRSWPSR